MQDPNPTAGPGGSAGLTLADVLDPDARGPREPELMRLAGLTALRRTDHGTFHYSNRRRGHLLYALILRHRPRTVLEIGTGRGYGALSMALAAEDGGLDTRIYTVDAVAPETPQPWPIDEGDGPRLATLSLREVWARLPAAWTRRVTCLTGTSVACMRAWLASAASPPVDFAFIDGGHDYWTVRHDVAAALVAARLGSVTMLLDDYGGPQGAGTLRFVDGDLRPRCPAGSLHILDMPTDDVARPERRHGMVYVDGRSGEVTGRNLLDPGDPEAVLRRLRRRVAVSDAFRRLRAGVGRVARRLSAARGRKRP